MRNLFIFFMLLSSFISAQEETNPNKQLYKTNKVKSVKVYEYRYRKGKPRGHGKLLFHYQYDTAGFLKVSDSHAFTKFHEEYVYNEHGDLADEIADIYGPFHTKYMYTYDEQGRMLKKQEGTDGDIWYYTYDAAGNKIKEKWLYYGEKMPGQFFIDYSDYNDKNQLLKMTRREATGAVYFYKTYEYDTAGNNTKQIRFQNNDTTDVFNYQYDANHNCIAEEVTGKDPTSIISWSKTNYDARGLETDETGQLSFEEKPYYRKYVYEYY